MESHSWQIKLLEGKICDFYGKLIFKMDICVFFLQTFLNICKQNDILNEIFYHTPEKCCIFLVWALTNAKALKVVLVERWTH